MVCSSGALRLFVRLTPKKDHNILGKLEKKKTSLYSEVLCVWVGVSKVAQPQSVCTTTYRVRPRMLYASIPQPQAFFDKHHYIEIWKMLTVHSANSGTKKKKKKLNLLPVWVLTFPLLYGAFWRNLIPLLIIHTNRGGRKNNHHHPSTINPVPQSSNSSLVGDAKFRRLLALYSRTHCFISRALQKREGCSLHLVRYKKGSIPLNQSNTSITFLFYFIFYDACSTSCIIGIVCLPSYYTPIYTYTHIKTYTYNLLILVFNGFLVILVLFSAF